MGRNNQTEGRFDIVKEAGIVANIVACELLDTSIIGNNNAATAVNIISQQFLTFRQLLTNQHPDIKQESDQLAKIISNGLFDAGIISSDADPTHALEIIAEEILVRWSMESL